MNPAGFKSAMSHQGTTSYLHGKTSTKACGWIRNSSGKTKPQESASTSVPTDGKPSNSLPSRTHSTDASPSVNYGFQPFVMIRSMHAGRERGARDRAQLGDRG